MSLLQLQLDQSRASKKLKANNLSKTPLMAHNVNFILPVLCLPVSVQLNKASIYLQYLVFILYKYRKRR